MHCFGSHIVAALVAVGAPVLAQNPTGHFNGRARLFNREVPIELEIARTDGGWRADLTVPQFGWRDVQFSRVSINGVTVELALDAPRNITFAGTFSPNGDTLAGQTRGRDSSAFSVVRGPDLTAQREAALGLPPFTPIETRATATLKIPGSADFLAPDADAAWVTNGNQIQKLESGRADPTLSATVPRACGGMVVAFDAVWAMSCRELALYRIDRTNGQLIASVKTGAAEPRGELSIAAGAGSVWVLSDSTGVLSRVDPSTNAVTSRIPVLASSYAADFGFGSVWITNTAASSVQRIDPATNTVVATIAVGPTPRFLAVGEGGVWTLNQGDGTVTRIDPATNRVAASIGVGVPGSGGDIAAGACTCAPDSCS